MTENIRYNNLVSTVIDNQDYYITVLSEAYYGPTKYHVWLFLMGLIETGCMTNERRGL